MLTYATRFSTLCRFEFERRDLWNRADYFLVRVWQYQMMRARRLARVRRDLASTMAKELAKQVLDRSARHLHRR